VLFSPDVTAALPGLATPAEPRDVVAFDPGTSTFSYAFVGAANGVPPGARIDAVSRDPAGKLLLSFDVTLTLPGVGTVDDEDLVRFSGGSFGMVFDGSANGSAPGQHPGPGTWEMYADASQSDPTHWSGVDLVALPEPGFAASFASGALLLALLGRRRAAR
jgi:hypothetical protein